MQVTRMLLPVVSVLFLGGCAVTAPELDRSDLAGDISMQGIALPESEMPRPSGELTLDGAIRQSIWRNPRMQSAYAELDLTAADVLEASQFANPSLRNPSLGWRTRGHPADLSSEPGGHRAGRGATCGRRGAACPARGDSDD